MNTQDTWFHLIVSLSLLAAIVVLNIVGKNATDIVTSLLVVLGGQLGYNFGVQKRSAINDPKDV